jgi:hypothetical protein
VLDLCLDLILFDDCKHLLFNCGVGIQLKLNVVLGRRDLSRQKHTKLVDMHTHPRIMARIRTSPLKLSYL